ncbi:MAG TPA: hypothetical protein VER03_11385 [Bryobacteraceae bacterium]|nr:hypothetical protein [Bryobacteraceae bacterium]
MLVVVVGMVVWTVTSIGNALNYTEVVAQVVRVEPVCRVSGTPIEKSGDCLIVAAQAGGQRILRHVGVRVRYRSPADGQEHVGLIIPVGTTKAAQARALRPGDEWEILAHDDDPNVVKLN